MLSLLLFAKNAYKAAIRQVLRRCWVREHHEGDCSGRHQGLAADQAHRASLRSPIDTTRGPRTIGGWTILPRLCWVIARSIPEFSYRHLVSQNFLFFCTNIQTFLYLSKLSRRECFICWSSPNEMGLVHLRVWHSHKYLFKQSNNLF